MGDTKEEMRAMNNSKYKWNAIQEIVSDLGCLGFILGLACLYVYLKLNT